VGIVDVLLGIERVTCKNTDNAVVREVVEQQPMVGRDYHPVSKS
jgi:hypothetical protein